MRRFISAMESATRPSERLLKTKVSAAAPAASNARAVSYSQFVPGKTGMKTLGLATFERAMLGARFSKDGFTISDSWESSARVGKTPSSVPLHAP